MAKPFLAPALVALRNELNARWPQRDHESDGWIGDTAHSARVSDHNPDTDGMVHAIDVDKDGIPALELVKFLVARHKSGADKRLWYVIFQRKIYSRTNGWAAKDYKGANAHEHHFHVSLRYDNDVEANTSSWLSEFQKPAKPTQPAKTASTFGPYAKVTAGSRTVSKGDAGDDVKKLQYILNHWYSLRLTEDGYFGASTENAVKTMQSRARLTADGVVGRKTWVALNVL